MMENGNTPKSYDEKMNPAEITASSSEDYQKSVDPARDVPQSQGEGTNSAKEIAGGSAGNELNLKGVVYHGKHIPQEEILTGEEMAPEMLSKEAKIDALIKRMDNLEYKQQIADVESVGRHSEPGIHVMNCLRKNLESIRRDEMEKQVSMLTARQEAYGSHPPGPSTEALEIQETVYHAAMQKLHHIFQAIDDVMNHAADKLVFISARNQVTSGSEPSKAAQEYDVDVPANHPETDLSNELNRLLHHAVTTLDHVRAVSSAIVS